MKEYNISVLMLERYRLGELNSEDASAVEAVLTADNNLRSRLAELDESDRQLRLQYPHITLPVRKFQAHKNFGAGLKKVRLAGIAAIFLVAVLLPVLYVVFIRDSGSGTANETVIAGIRPKGNTTDDFELSIFLRGGGNDPLPDSTMLEEGNTVQLAYTAPAEGEYYGVIFSIDSRSVVTMHYPYRMGQSPRMVSGRQTLLNQAYMLDDAPMFEVFVMVVSDEVLDVDTVLQKARDMAGINEAQKIIDTSKTVFEDKIIETITVLK